MQRIRFNAMGHRCELRFIPRQGWLSVVDGNLLPERSSSYHRAVRVVAREIRKPE